MANDIYLDQKHSELVDELCQGEARIFNNNAYGSVVFALIGYANQHRAEPDSSRKREVPGGALENADAEAYAYLMTVVENETDPGCLRPEHDKEIWRRFEEYANGGLEILSEWILESNTAVTEVMLQKMYNVIIKLDLNENGSKQESSDNEDEFMPTINLD